MDSCEANKQTGRKFPSQGTKAFTRLIIVAVFTV